MEEKHQIAAALPMMDFKATNLAKEWKTWHTKFKIFLRASNLETEPDKRKVALLLHHLGSQSLEIFNSFDMDIDTVTYEDLVRMLGSHFTPKANIVMERHRFFTCKQQDNQTIDEYVTILRNLSLNCEFGDLKNDLVRDIFICGLSQKHYNIKERLLTEDKINLEKSIEIANNIVLAKSNAAMLQEDGFMEGSINAMSKKSGRMYGYNSNNTKSESGKCKKCGQSHKYNCPAEGAKCFKCGKLNHFARVCINRRKFVKQMQAEEEANDGDDDDQNSDLFVGVLNKRGKSSTEWNVHAVINDKMIQCQVDTGAQANIMSVDTAGMLKIKDKLKK
ncbi:uncharacterized protein LOC133334373, partial [Musca vetustissima]|uniref:uncharacterized protein LOC133334373 n=1 Tax=Musca vetustissima TaxID=27455 RepID=UPI002AB7C395